MSVIHWQVNAFKWLFPFVLSILLMLSGCGSNSQFTHLLSSDSKKVESPVSSPEPTVEVAPVNPPIAAIAPAPKVELPATEPTDIAASLPETLELAPADSSISPEVVASPTQDLPVVTESTPIAASLPEEALELAPADSSISPEIAASPTQDLPVVTESTPIAASLPEEASESAPNDNSISPEVVASPTQDLPVVTELAPIAASLPEEAPKLAPADNLITEPIVGEQLEQ